jgi:glycosyltransferase involved in cell wall biosynthesis
VEALAAALARLATDEALRARLAAAGAAHVTTAFDWERAASRLEGLFRETLHRASVARVRWPC